jgi:hypothetical protein
MRGPIDYIIVGFKGNKFDGSILKALGDAIDSGVISLVALVMIIKDKDGTVTKVDITNLGDEYVVEFAEKYQAKDDYVTGEDVEEMGDLLENDTSAGLLVIEQLWAKPLKKSILDANGVLVAEGRIHPEAAAELNKEGE